MEDPDVAEDIDPEDVAEDPLEVPLDQLALEQDADLLLDDEGPGAGLAPPPGPARAPEGARAPGARIDFTDATVI
eukprot:14725424-Heterocapsa_arctica.AAC.1